MRGYQMKNIDFKEDNIVKRNKIPILIYVPEWIQIFSNYRSRSMNKAITKLEELIYKEKEKEAELESFGKRKKLIMNKILYLSKDINENNNEAALSKMGEAEKELLEINRKIPTLIEELEILPGQINEINTQLLKETIKRSYELINEYKSESEKCQDQVNEIRQKLAALIQKKVDMEERINKLYSFTHGMVGAAEMESLDEDFLL
jgi:flagellar biosynthesis/type III secretory pathway chaperone